MTDRTPRWFAIVTIAALVGIAACSRGPDVTPRETSEDVAARQQARSYGDEDVADDYAAIGDATARYPEVAGPEGAPPDDRRGAADDERIEEPEVPVADAREDYMIARQSCEAIEDSQAQ
ncbi:MAG TPA: hypothetical protein VLT59_09175, partial [Steroidobacteraceae bacterium]|nr:hypothetical protein [Steroidobacteraceae bacterium]